MRCCRDSADLADDPLLTDRSAPAPHAASPPRLVSRFEAAAFAKDLAIVKTSTTIYPRLQPLVPVNSLRRAATGRGAYELIRTKQKLPHRSPSALAELGRREI